MRDEYGYGKSMFNGCVSGCEARRLRQTPNEDIKNTHVAQSCRVLLAFFRQPGGTYRTVSHTLEAILTSLLPHSTIAPEAASAAHQPQRRETSHLFRGKRALDDGDYGIDDSRSSASHGETKRAPAAAIRSGHDTSFLGAQAA